MLSKIFNWLKGRFSSKATRDNSKTKKGFNSDNPFLIL